VDEFFLESARLFNLLIDHSHEENVKFEAHREYLDNDIRLIKEPVPSVPTELLFKIGENRFSDWGKASHVRSDTDRS
jgi:hypothetical protein